MQWSYVFRDASAAGLRGVGVRVREEGEPDAEDAVLLEPSASEEELEDAQLQARAALEAAASAVEGLYETAAVQLTGHTETRTVSITVTGG